MNLREATKDELNLAAHAWAQSAQDFTDARGSETARPRTDVPKGWTPQTYRHVMRMGLWSVVNAPGTRVTVLELVDDQVTALAVWEPSTSGNGVLMHYVYTKRGKRDGTQYRRNGLASALLDHVLAEHPGDVFATFMTPAGLRFLNAYRERRHAA